uniref:BED-type domain-containing protein n=1 Tax=Maylandia zebra TaxID=106582 RepID=A0A3P9D5A2_9CICH
MLKAQFERDTVANKLFLKKKYFRCEMKEGEHLNDHLKRMKELTDQLGAIGSVIEEEDQIGERCSFFSWKYGHYFEFLSTKDLNIKVRCTLCVGEKVLSTFKNTTSNLKKHLESQHSTVKLTERVPPSGPKQRAVTSAEGPTPPKQQKLDFGAKPVSDEELKKLVAQYIVEEMLPINTVDSPSFRAIIKKIPTSVNAELPHRTTFTSYLEKEFTEMERNLKATLNEIDFVSTTADIWTANNRSYMGVTLHWISRTTLERHKVALACRQIRGRHTYDVIGTEIENIHSSYGLLNKVVATVTDNGSNFVKAFQVYHPVTESDDETEEEESSPKDDDVTFSDLSEILSAENESDGQLSLPPHRRCASHTINIICTRDVEKHLTTNEESRLLTAECCTTAPLAKNPASVPSATTSSSQGEMDFFTFEAEPEEETYSAEKEVMDYLMSGYDLQILHKFSSIKTIFLKYNTPTPSSAPVERLFSLGGLVLMPKRNRLSHKRFEKLLLMRYNHWFTRSTLLFPP